MYAEFNKTKSRETVTDVSACSFLELTIRSDSYSQCRHSYVGHLQLVQTFTSTVQSDIYRSNSYSYVRTDTIFLESYSYIRQLQIKQLTQVRQLELGETFTVRSKSYSYLNYITVKSDGLQVRQLDLCETITVRVSY